MKKLFLFIIVISFCSCNFFKGKKSTEQAVARVYDEYLYSSDLIGIVPEGFSKQDSIEIIKDYIDNWIRQKILIKQAESNLSSEQKDFTKQLEEYKNSLIVYQYERSLISQKMDTSITEPDIENYYNKNIKDFELKSNIVKVLYIKLNKTTPLAMARSYIKSEKPQDRKKLEEFCLRYGQNYMLDDEKWLLFDDILKEIPIKTYNQEEYLKNNRYIEISDSLNTYLLNIKGFMIKESVSPLSFEKQNIREIIANKRKLKLIETMRNDIYEKALKNGDFEVFNKKK